MIAEYHNPDLDMMNPLQVLNNAYIEGDYDAIVHCRRVLGMGAFKPSKGFPIQNLSIPGHRLRCERGNTFTPSCELKAELPIHQDTKPKRTKRRN